MNEGLHIDLVVSDAAPRGEDGEISDVLDGRCPPPVLTDVARRSGARWVTPAWPDWTAPEQSPDGVDVQIVDIDESVRDRAFLVWGDPMLWFVNHRLWDLPDAPDIRAREIEAYRDGYAKVNVALAQAAARAVEDVKMPVVVTYGYHAMTAAGTLRGLRPDARLRLYVPTAWGAPEDWQVVPVGIQEEIYRAMLANDVVAFPARRHARTFVRCCMELFDLPADPDTGTISFEGRTVLARGLPVSTDQLRLETFSRRREVIAYEETALATRRQYSLLLVADADLAANVLRSFSAFDLFIEQHPEYQELVKFDAYLRPTRTDIAEYAEYLERIEALVAVINHRHGTPDWMPLRLKLSHPPAEIVAHLRLCDALVVPALRQGVDPIIEALSVMSPRDALIVLSTGASASEQLRDGTLSVQPFDIQGLADRYHKALSRSFDRRAEDAGRVRAEVVLRTPEDWLAELLAPAT